jgi:hypothetical protein
MLSKTEIALLQLATNEIRKKENTKVPNEKKKSGLFLYNSLVKYGLTQLFREKSEDIFMWCMSVTGNKIELPIPLDENDEISVIVDVWKGEDIDHILDINLNGLKYLHLEYDHKDNVLHQYNYNDPHGDDFTNEQTIDVKSFKETSSLSVIAELEEKYGVDIRISPVPEQESLVYGIVAGSDSSKCSAITTKDYPSTDALLEALENEILPEYQKMADSFVKLNSLVKVAKIL